MGCSIGSTGFRRNREQLSHASVSIQARHCSNAPGTIAERPTRHKCIGVVAIGE